MNRIVIALLNGEMTVKRLEKHKDRVLLCSENEDYPDFFVKEEDDFYILEVNTHPGMTPLSICPEISQKMGIGFEALVEEILGGAAYES